MSLQRFLPFVLILSLVLAAISCNDDWLRSEYDTTVRWEGGIKGPVLFGNLTLQDLLEEYDTTGYVSQDSTGLLYAAYSVDTVLTAPAFIEIPDQEFIQVFFRVDSNIPGDYLNLLGDTISFTQDKGFEFKRIDDERLDSVHIKDGDMRIYVSSTIKHKGILTVSSDRIFVGGRKYEEVIQISNASGNFDTTVNIPMDGGSILLDNSVPDSTSLYLKFDFDLINSGADILVSEEVEIRNSFHDLEFLGAYGYVGTFDSLLIDRAELEFDVLEGNFEGTIKLANPQLIIRTDNSVGIPFGIELGDLQARFKDGSSTGITIDTSVNPVKIAAPDLSQIDQYVKDSTRIDNTNSDIHIAATTDLTGFQYSVRVMANPDGQVDNYILDDSELKVNVEGLIPLDLRIQDVVLGDTFDFDVGPEEDSDFGAENVDYMMMRMETDNSMPLDLGIQVYFIDTTRNWMKVDSLFGADRDVFKSGIIDDEGRVIQATNKVTEVEFTDTQIENILDANKLILKAYVETSEGGTKDVKFYADYSLDFKLGTQIELNYTTK
jgi:hypothetical protein